MSQNIRYAATSFESLINSVGKLSIDEKFKLWKILDEQLSQIEEELWSKDTSIQGEIREAREAYLKGDFVTIDEYIKKIQK
jgi:predicted oxidoreductase (fatty acid repression mutant protein)